MRTKTGTISSARMSKTVVVVVHSFKNHPKYKKRYRTTKKYHAHDEHEICKEGDTVIIAEHPPISKLKRWKIIEINGTPLNNNNEKHKKTLEQTIETPQQSITERNETNLEEQA